MGIKLLIRSSQRLLAGFCLLCCFSNIILADNSPQVPSSYAPSLPLITGQVPVWVSGLTQTAEKYFFLGTQAFDEGRYVPAREYFNLSIDFLFESGVGVKSNSHLYAYYVQLVERIRQYDIQIQQTEIGWGQQAYVPSPLDLLSGVDVVNENSAGISILTDLDFEAGAITPEVRSFVKYFTSSKGRPTMVAGLRRAGRFFHLTRRIFGEEKVPLDLIWLAQAESGWRNNALSTASAYGIWQFIPSTGARFGLIQNSLIDERAGIEQPTRAAAKYLRWLYNRYGNWLLAMAAYNCGEGNLDRALARSNAKDFWGLYRQGLLPQETRNYVPIILSIILIAKHPERYGFSIKAEQPLSYDFIELTTATDLRQIAPLSGISLDSLRELNPELLQFFTPSGKYKMRIPKGTYIAVETALTAINGQSKGIHADMVRYKKRSKRTVVIQKS